MNFGPGAHPHSSYAQARALLTRAQSETLEMIEQYYEATRQPCPITYIAKRTGRHHETARDRIAALFAKGFVVAPGSPVTPTAPLAAPRLSKYSHVVYLLLNVRARLVKIGRTNELERRIHEIKRSVGNVVMLIGACDSFFAEGREMTELCWHRKFAASRATGEWFALTPDLRHEIAARFGLDLAAEDSSPP